MCAGISGQESYLHARGAALHAGGCRFNPQHLLLKVLREQTFGWGAAASRNRPFWLSWIVGLNWYGNFLWRFLLTSTFGLAGLPLRFQYCFLSLFPFYLVPPQRICGGAAALHAHAPRPSVGYQNGGTIHNESAVSCWPCFYHVFLTRSRKRVEAKVAVRRVCSHSVCLKRGKRYKLYTRRS